MSNSIALQSEPGAIKITQNADGCFHPSIAKTIGAPAPTEAARTGPIVVTGIGLFAALDLSAAELASRARRPDEDRGLATQDLELPADLGAQERAVPIAALSRTRLETLPGLRRPLPDKLTLMAIAAAEAALHRAGLPNAAVETHRIATIANTCAGPNATVERFLRTLLVEGPTAISPIVFSRTVPNALLGEIARRHGLTGPSTLIMGSSAIGYGVDMLRAGTADVCLCMGLDETRPGQVWAYRRAGVDAEGMIFGEASVAVVLETEVSARARGAQPLAQVIDVSMSFCPEAAVLLTKATSDSIGASMRMALLRADRSAADVTAVVCADNGDRELARAEDAAIQCELPQNVERLFPKKCLGETFGASELLGVIAAVGLVEPSRPNGLYLVNSVQPGGAVSSILMEGVS